jgi:hypothetical protein
MTHLSEEHLLELLDGGTSEASHLESCAACREKLDTLRQMMALVRDDQVSEPSPLFWQHFSERVRLAIDDDSGGEESLSVRWWTRGGWRWALAGVAAVLIATLVVVTSTRTERTDLVENRPASSAPSVGSAGADDLSWAPPVDDSWAMVVGVAESLDLESAADAGLTVQPGSVDQAVGRLSDEEQRDLAGIIQAELDRLSL